MAAGTMEQNIALLAPNNITNPKPYCVIWVKYFDDYSLKQIKICILYFEGKRASGHISYRSL